MLPFGTQIAFVCNQPRNFALWRAGKPMDNLDPEVASLEVAYRHISDTQALLSEIDLEVSQWEDSQVRVELGQGLYLELSGRDYVNEFLMPNFYFHLVTAYNILCMAGVSIGKRDYMWHIGSQVKQG